jgi:hypothetical protein
VKVFPLNVSTVLITAITLSHDYAVKKNNNVSDITRNLRNFRPTFELREQWLFTNQVRFQLPRYVRGLICNVDVRGWCIRRVYID